MKAKLTVNQKRLIPVLREAGVSVVEIARRFGVSQSCVLFWSDPEKWRPRYAEANRKERQNKPEKVRKRSLNWRRKHATRLKTGVYISHTNSKRPYPPGGLCEICGRTARLRYHHWEDTKPHVGIWICEKCHRPIEFIDFPPDIDFTEKYLAKKAVIEKGLV